MPDLQSKNCAIGLDVGGTKIAAGLVLRDTGKILSRQVIATHASRGGQAVLADALGLTERLIHEADVQGLNLCGIGIGLAELVDLDGNVTSDQTIAWRGLPIQETFGKLAPALVDSDVRAPALAEAMFGAGQMYSLFVYVTIGTGISSCLVQDGVPFAGARGNALVLASSPMTSTCPVCGTTSTRTLEEIASGPALVHLYNEASSSSTARAEEVLAAAVCGNAEAIRVVENAGQALGARIGLIVDLLDPQAIVIGGGLGLAGGLYWDTFVSAARAHIYADSSRGLAILPAALGVDAGLVGAAANVFRRFG